MITTSCDLACPGCDRFIDHGHAFVEKFEDIVANMEQWFKRLDPDHVTIIGGEKKILDSSIATIRDRNATVAIAGIIGCDNSSVTSETKNFLVESAAFLPNVIMNKARKLSLNTSVIKYLETILSLCSKSQTWTQARHP